MSLKCAVPLRPLCTDSGSLKFSLFIEGRHVMPLRPPSLVPPHGQHPLLIFLTTCQGGCCSRQQVHWAVALLTEAGIAGTALVYLIHRGRSRAESRAATHVRGGGMVLWG